MQQDPASVYVLYSYKCAALVTFEEWKELAQWHALCSADFYWALFGVVRYREAKAASLCIVRVRLHEQASLPNLLTIGL